MSEELKILQIIPAAGWQVETVGNTKTKGQKHSRALACWALVEIDDDESDGNGLRYVTGMIVSGHGLELVDNYEWDEMTYHPNRE